MKRAILLLFAVVLSLHAQSPTANPKEKTGSATDDNPNLRASIVRLVELTEVKQTLQNKLPEMVDEGRKKMMEYCKTCTPEFGDEWAKRMVVRLKVDDFIAVYVRVYQKYLSEEDVAELIDLQTKRKASQAVRPSPRLKEKLTSAMPSILSEAMAGCAQISAKLGAEIGQEIEKEHPEYVGGAASPQ